jgi:glycosyltransferase involved in cell wall biosynthesis
MESLRIAVLNWRDLTHPEAGGAERLVHESACELIRRGHSVTLFTARYPGSAAIDSSLEYQIERYGSRFSVYPRVARVLKDRTNKGEFDVVVEHVNGIPWFSPFWSGVPNVAIFYHLVGSAFFLELPFPISLIGFSTELATPILYGRTDCVYLGPSSATEFQSLGARREYSHIIPPGVDLATYTVKGQKSPEPTFIMLGPVKSYKNQDLAIKAIALVRRAVPNARLILTGWARGDILDRLKLLVNRLGIAGAVDFAGFLPESIKIQKIQEAWALLYCSDREGWGLGAIEASACGTPTIAPKIGGLKDSVIEGSTGLMYPPRDLSALVASMDELVRDEALRARMAIECRRFASQFDWGVHGDRIESLLREVASRRGNQERIQIS